MLLVISVGPKGMKKQTYADPLCLHQDDVDHKECQQHLGREKFVVLDEFPRAEKHEGENHQTDNVGFTDICKL